MNNDRNERLLYGLGIAALVILLPNAALAYVGPGLGLGALSSFFALVGAVFLGIVGFIWYPIKRLLRMFRRTAATDE